MPRLIILARHGAHAEVGRVLSGRSEIPLSSEGEREAAALARAAQDVGLASLHASPRRRTQQTAAPVATALGLPVTTAPALDEIDFGAFSGRSFDALAGDAAWQLWNAARDTARCPGGETMAEAVARAQAYLAALPAAQTPALCVTHCDIIRGIVANVLGVSYAKMFALDCDPGSLTTLAVEGEAWRLVSLNLRPA